MPTPLPRETKTVTLKCGWVVELVTYFTQGEFEQIQDVWVDAMFDENVEKHSREESKQNLAILRKATDLAKSFAVRKVTLPDGTVYEKDACTLDVVKSIPYNPDDPEDELATKISEITRKKATTDVSTNSST